MQVSCDECFLLCCRNPWQWNFHVEKDFPAQLDQQIAVSHPDGRQDLHQHPQPCEQLPRTILFLCDPKHRWSESLAWIARFQKSQLPNRSFSAFTGNPVSSVSFKITGTNNQNLSFPSVFSVFNLWHNYLSTCWFLRSEFFNAILINLPIWFKLKQCTILYILTFLQVAESKVMCMVMCL